MDQLRLIYSLKLLCHQCFVSLLVRLCGIFWNPASIKESCVHISGIFVFQGFRLLSVAVCWTVGWLGQPWVDCSNMIHWMLVSGPQELTHDSGIAFVTRMQWLGPSVSWFKLCMHINKLIVSSPREWLMSLTILGIYIPAIGKWIIAMLARLVQWWVASGTFLRGHPQHRIKWVVKCGRARCLVCSIWSFYDMRLQGYQYYIS